MEYLYEKLTAYGNSDYYAFHMPGHKRNMELMRARLPYNIDITEIDGFDDLHHAEGLLKELQENAARVFQAEETDLNGEIHVDQIKKLLEEYEDIQVVVIVSPTYEGVVSDIEAIAEIVHEYKIPLIVDEAHGAHLGFHSYIPHYIPIYDNFLPSRFYHHAPYIPSLHSKVRLYSR